MHVMYVCFCWRERDVMWCSSATSRLNSFFPILQAVITERTSRVASNLIRSKSTDLHSFFPPLRRLPFFIFTHFNRQGYREEPTYPRINCCSLFSLSFSFYFPVEHTQTLHLLWPLLLLITKKSNVIVYLCKHNKTTILINMIVVIFLFISFYAPLHKLTLGWKKTIISISDWS